MYIREFLTLCNVYTCVAHPIYCTGVVYKRAFSSSLNQLVRHRERSFTPSESGLGGGGTGGGCASQRSRGPGRPLPAIGFDSPLQHPDPKNPDHATGVSLFEMTAKYY